MYSKEFLKEIPKTDLHLHLDGSLRIPTLIELAKKNNVKLPSYTEEGLKELVFKDRYVDLVDYLKGFGYTTAVMQNEESLERIAYELVWDSINDGVYYIEPRFAPQLHINDNLSFEQVMISVNKGLARAKSEFNNSPKVKSGELPEFHYGIINCAMRFFLPVFSSYYKKIFDVHSYSKPEEIYAYASEELAKASFKIIDEQNIPIVGFDLAGAEAGFPAGKHKKSFQYAHEHFINKTVHAGEAYGAESIFQAVTDLHANRIGHGFYIFDANKIENPNIKDKEKYIRNIANYIGNSRITIEVCLTSNLQTNPNLKDVKQHSFKKMLEAGLSVTLCTDNTLVSNTTATKEVKLATDNFDIKPKKLKNIIIYGFKRNFFFGSYTEKREYCRKIIDFYEKIEKKHSIAV
ncbi:MAG TPA: adenosine deaminase family protein [bacterium]|nr:adenosine deaminase family protein [bacterium]